jgi:hypothetical protein
MDQLPLTEWAFRIFQLNLQPHKAATLFALFCCPQKHWAFLTHAHASIGGFLINMVVLIYYIPWSRCPKFFLVFLPRAHWKSSWLR